MACWDADPERRPTFWASVSQLQAQSGFIPNAGNARTRLAAGNGPTVLIAAANFEHKTRTPCRVGQPQLSTPGKSKRPFNGPNASVLI